MKETPQTFYHREVVVRMAGPAAQIFALFRLLCQRMGDVPIGDI